MWTHLPAALVHLWRRGGHRAVAVDGADFGVSMAAWLSGEAGLPVSGLGWKFKARSIRAAATN